MKKNTIKRIHKKRAVFAIFRFIQQQQQKSLFCKQYKNVYSTKIWNWFERIETIEIRVHKRNISKKEKYYWPHSNLYIYKWWRLFLSCFERSSFLFRFNNYLRHSSTKCLMKHRNVSAQFVFFLLCLLMFCYGILKKDLSTILHVAGWSTKWKS